MRVVEAAEGAEMEGGGVGATPLGGRFPEEARMRWWMTQCEWMEQACHGRPQAHSQRCERGVLRQGLQSMVL